MRTTEIFTVIAVVLVLIIMRSQTESFWPFSLFTRRPAPETPHSAAILNMKKMIRDGRATVPKNKKNKKKKTNEFRKTTVLDQHNSRAFDPSYFAVATPQGAKKQSRKSYNRRWS